PLPPTPPAPESHRPSAGGSWVSLLAFATSGGVMAATSSAKTCVITGATSGIGLAAAAALAGRGLRLVLLARSPARAEAALEAIRRRSPAARPEVVPVELASLRSIAEAAAQVRARCPRIDVLLNNAGVFLLRRETSADGYEKTFAV